jgi:hypothetical protein
MGSAVSGFLMEQLDCNLLFRWFVGLSMDDPVWDASTFSKNRERLLAGDIAQRFLEAVLAQAKAGDLTSDEHFSIDGTLIEAWASQKSFKPKDGSGGDGPQGRNPHVDFKGEPRKNDTHQSTTDPDARLYRKGDGQESKLSYLGHVVMENRNGLVVGCDVTLADGYGERAAGRTLTASVERRPRVTLGADKAYDTEDFVRDMRSLGVTPHVAQNKLVGRHFTRRIRLHTIPNARPPAFFSTLLDGASDRNRTGGWHRGLRVDPLLEQRQGELRARRYRPHPVLDLRLESVAELVERLEAEGLVHQVARRGLGSTAPPRVVGLGPCAPSTSGTTTTASRRSMPSWPAGALLRGGPAADGSGRGRLER